MPSAVAHVGGGIMGSEVSLSPTTVEYYYHQPLPQPPTSAGVVGGAWVSHADRLASGEHWTLGLEGGRLQSSPESPPPTESQAQAAARGFRPHDLRVSTVEEGSREGSGASGENGGITPSVLANVTTIDLNHDEHIGPAAGPEEERLPPLPSPLTPRPSMSPILRPSIALSRPSISSLREGATTAGVGAHARTRTLSSPVVEARPARSSPTGVEGRPSVSSLAEAGRPSLSRPSTSSLRETYTAPAPRPARSSPIGVEARPPMSPFAETGRPSLTRPSTSSLRETYTAPAPRPAPSSPLGVEARPPMSPFAEAGRSPLSRPSTSSLRETYTAPAPRPPPPGRRRGGLRERRSDLEQAKPQMWK
ncbi:hypothetical protein M407DRAFT_153190 [Tulasnella calospora MUT 4182]|uniref:Uncharacterized protein n=1 Tax=Tulasnella calospora MUT 4182 TaxID=1051891 RepID=A0A0C3Q6P0_9AGAM|nr:hypothetical protein M407DRAFT_153190 [Tulasnella calospora MUT 4182]